MQFLLHSVENYCKSTKQMMAPLYLTTVVGLLVTSTVLVLGAPISEEKERALSATLTTLLQEAMRQQQVEAAVAYPDQSAREQGYLQELRQTILDLLEKAKAHTNFTAIRDELSSLRGNLRRTILNRLQEKIHDLQQEQQSNSGNNPNKLALFKAKLVKVILNCLEEKIDQLQQQFQEPTTEPTTELTEEPTTEPTEEPTTEASETTSTDGTVVDIVQRVLMELQEAVVQVDDAPTTTGTTLAINTETVTEQPETTAVSPIRNEILLALLGKIGDLQDTLEKITINLLMKSGRKNGVNSLEGFSLNGMKISWPEDNEASRDGSDDLNTPNGNTEAEMNNNEETNEKEELVAMDTAGPPGLEQETDREVLLQEFLNRLQKLEAEVQRPPAGK